MKYLYIHNQAASKVDEDNYPTSLFTPSDLRTRDYSLGASNSADYTKNLVGHGDRNFAPLVPEDDTQDLWIHFKFVADTARTFQVSFFLATATAITDDRVLEVIAGGMNSDLQVITNNNPYIDAAGLFNQGEEVFVDVQIRRPSGETRLYVNGVERFSATDAIAGAVGTANLGQLRINALGGADSIPSEVIVTEGHPTIGMRVITLDPESNGSEATMTGNISDLASVGLTEEGLVETTATTHLFNYEDVGAGVDLTGMEIKAVSVATVASRDVLNINDQMFHVVKQNGVKYELGTGHDVTTRSNEKGLVDIMTTSPETGAQWTIDEINALEVGSKFQKKP